MEDNVAAADRWAEFIAVREIQLLRRQLPDIYWESAVAVCNSTGTRR